MENGQKVNAEEVVEAFAAFSLFNNTYDNQPIPEDEDVSQLGKSLNNVIGVSQNVNVKRGD